MNNIPPNVKITIESHGHKTTHEFVSWDTNTDELMDKFVLLAAAAGWPLSSIEDWIINESEIIKGNENTRN